MDRERVERRLAEIDRDAKQGGYRLNPDREFISHLVEGLLVNAERYGMEACPCRLLMGAREDNLDIVCPCNYRDDDLAEHGACFCALYVQEGFQPGKQIPDRRSKTRATPLTAPTTLAYPVWRCSVCGYLCAKNNPPGKCPVCKADSERFERFV